MMFFKSDFVSVGGITRMSLDLCHRIARAQQVKT